MNKVLIAPSILSADFANLESEIKRVEDGGADILHVDVMDGVFVPNITIGAPVVKAIKKVTKLPLDVHLMIVEPEKHIPDFAKAGADIITVHEEACPDIEKTISMIQELGVKAGVSIKPNTPVEKYEAIVEKMDLALIMSVEPGFGGQKFMPNSIDKIKALKSIAEAKGRQTSSDIGFGGGIKDLVIEVDGGVAPGEIASTLVNAGATALVAGSAIYKSDDIPATISALRN